VDRGRRTAAFRSSAVFESEIANRKLTGGFKHRQRIGHDPSANDELVCGAHQHANIKN
jgi:hypothetical protein